MADDADPVYLRVTDGSERDYYNLTAGMLRCRHLGNPDFAELYPRVAFWFVEVVGGRCVREVGFAPLFGASGDAVPIVLGPWGRNPGLWATLDLSCDRQGTEVSAEEFEAAWARAADRSSR